MIPDREEIFESFIQKLKQRIELPLPGKVVQLKMASTIRNKELGFIYDTSTAIRSSVLVLLYPKENQIYTVFILRQTYNGVHSGQVSFPGGRVEKTDQSCFETAIREAHEEVNILPDEMQVIGTLSELYIPPSNFLVLPVIGYTKKPPQFKPDPSEVAEIIESDISFLFDENAVKRKIINIKGIDIEAPYFDVKGNMVWGATAMILNELKEVILSID